MSIQEIRAFVEQPARPQVDAGLTAVSLFSGAGLSDVGYATAGFRLVVQVERDPSRAAVGARNFPYSEWLTRDVRTAHDEIAAVYRDRTDRQLDFLVATPPCQGMSSSNPGRGRRSAGQALRKEELNRLILEIIPAAARLRPRIIVAENVRPVLTLEVDDGGRRRRVIDHLHDGLPQYRLFSGIVNVADYGIPQHRRRAVVAAVRRDEPWLDLFGEAGIAPWPRATHAECPEDGIGKWTTIRQWMEELDYEPLDSASPEAAIGEHPLHDVPNYADNQDRYLQISEIPPYSGRSAYENETCPTCHSRPIPAGSVKCARGHFMRNRPYVRNGQSFRLVRGFRSSYRRMAPDQPARTITTNTSHVGSDFKIHPWENRVLSTLECSDLQTVPRSYDWSGAIDARPKSKRYLIRNLIGEAFPPYFTFLHGQLLAGLLRGSQFDANHFAPARH